MSDHAITQDVTVKANDTSHQSWARWQPEPIQHARPSDTLKETPPPNKEAQARLENDLQQQFAHARTQGYDAGHESGYTDGMQQGLTQGYQQGQHDGYEAGFATGRHEGRSQAEQEAAQLAALTQQCATALSHIETEVGQALVTLAIRIAEQIVRHTLDTQPKAILALIDDLFQVNTDDSGTLQLYVNPADFALVHEHLTDHIEATQWRVLPDDTITPGGCQARTGLGDIDATLEKRWKLVTSALKGELP